MERVRGIGGVFFRARDQEALGRWYEQHLGIEIAEWGGKSLPLVGDFDAGGAQ